MAKSKTAKAKKTSKKKETAISAKQYGRNIVLIVDGEKYSRAFNDKGERQDMLLTVENYNAKPTKKLKNSILTTMLEFEKEKADNSKKVEEAKKTLKSSAKAKKPQAAQLTAEEVKQVRELLKANTNVISRPAPQRRSGEY